MTTGAKIAIGCAAAFVAAGIVVSALVVGGAFWAKSKIEQATGDFSGEVERIDKLQKQVDAYPFTLPQGGVIQEDRLVKFLEVRKGVFAIYEANLPEFEKIKGEPQGLDALKTLGKTALVFKEIRVAVLEGLAREHMSEAEYRYIAGEVYRTVGAAAVAGATAGQSATEATDQGIEQATEALKAGQEALENAPPELRDQLKALTEQIHQGTDQARAAAAQLEVPPENLELFNKYKLDIAKYAMTGLETAGF